MLGRRQRLVLVASFAVGAGLGELLPRIALVLPPSTPLGQAAVLPAALVESGTLAEPDHFAASVFAVAGRYGLDPALVLALIEAESGRDPAALSSKGAVGLMQVMPETAALVGIAEPADPATNLEAGCRYLATLMDSFGGDVELALAAYNAGPGAVRRWGTIPPYRETRTFVRRVAEAYRRLTGTDLLSTERVIAAGAELAY